MRRKSTSLPVFWTSPPLFSRVNGRAFFGRALSRSQMAFSFSTFLLRFGGVLEETHGTAYLEVVREVLKEEQEL